MKWKEFANKVSPSLIARNEGIGLLGFKYKGKKYRITSQWGSGDDRENVNLWGKIIGDNSDRIYPFTEKQVDKLKFFKI